MFCRFVSGFGVPVSVFDSQKETTRECPRVCFSCVLITCNGLACSLQSHLCRSLQFLSLLQLKNARNKKRNGLHTPREGRFRELGPIILFFVYVFFVSCYFWSASYGLTVKGWPTKKWQDLLTICHFCPLRLCKLVFGCLLFAGVCGFIRTQGRKTYGKCSKYPWGDLGAWGIGEAISFLIYSSKYAKRMCKNIGSQWICRNKLILKLLGKTLQPTHLQTL